MLQNELKKKKKRWKEMKTLSDTSGEHYNTPIFELQVYKKKKNINDWRKCLK